MYRQLQDSPTADWPGSVIEEIVKQHVDDWGVDAVSTEPLLQLWLVTDNNPK